MNIFSGAYKSTLKYTLGFFIFSLFAISNVAVADISTIQSDLQAAENYKTEGDMYKATYYYQVALSKDENNAEALYALANIAYAKRQYQMVLTRLDKVLQNDAYSADALLLRGKTYSMQKKWKKALRDLELAEQMDSENPEVQLALDQVYSAKGETAKAEQSIKNHRRLKEQQASHGKQVIK